MNLVQIFLVFGMPLVAAALATGETWKKVRRYSGTVVVELLSILVFAVIYQGGPHPIARIAFPLSANVLMIALVVSGTRKSK